MDVGNCVKCVYIYIYIITKVYSSWDISHSITDLRRTIYSQVDIVVNGKQNKLSVTDRMRGLRDDEFLAWGVPAGIL